jgi:hypothetical protein
MSQGELSNSFPYGAVHYSGQSSGQYPGNSFASDPWQDRPLRLSVIVATADRAGSLAQTLQSIYAQTVIPYELVVVDQSVDCDQARETHDKFASPFVVRPKGMRFTYDRGVPGAGKTQGRNRGKQLARGDVLLFVDDTVQLEPCFIEEILKTYHDDAFLDGVAGTVIEHEAPADEAASYWFQALYSFETGLEPPSADPEALEGAAVSFRSDSIRNVPFEEGRDLGCRLRERGPAHLVQNPRAVCRR